MPEALTSHLTTNRRMYWRIVRRMLLGNRARLSVILLALGAGATVTAALLNLEVDAKSRITSEFKAFGPNVILWPRAPGASSATLEQGTIDAIPQSGEVRVSPSSFLSVIVTVGSRSGRSLSAVAVGHQPFASLFAMHGGQTPKFPELPCVLGKHVAGALAAAADSELRLESGGRSETCRVASILETGGPEDNQVWIALPMAQRLAAAPRQVNAIELTVSGTPSAIRSYVALLERAFPQLDVRPVRQFTEGQARIYARISGLLNLTVGMVLVLTVLCVMAAMANVAIERRNDVGLMKAIGGATRRVLRLFLAEAAVLGVVAGLMGGALGILMSLYLGKAVFGLAARPRWVVYPVSVMLTLIVAIAASFPLRQLAGIRPASVFRGET